MNFIGKEQLEKLNLFLLPKELPEPPLVKEDELVIFGPSKLSDGRNLTINNMRLMFGIDPEEKEPCFYNQDWYLKEDFASKITLEDKWYLIKKTVKEQTRGKNPDDIGLDDNEKFPSAILTAFVFFTYWFLTDGDILWKNDFIWCSDIDNNGDRIYTGRYIDDKKINKNGFNVHRHLSIKHCYGLAAQKL